MPVSRREWLASLVPAVLGLRQAPSGQDSLPGGGPEGGLRDPESAGRPADPATARDNDPAVVALEHRLKCTCGCNLDIYTCRTTDFNCTYSPRLHQEVLALQSEGKAPQEIVAAFVARYGEQILMAPPATGFNLAGYLVPGISVLLVASLMVVVLRRRAARMRLAPVGRESANAARGAGTLSPEDQARLDRELAGLDEASGA